MAVGFTKDGAVQEQIDNTISDALSSIRGYNKNTNISENCLECGGFIPASRRQAILEVDLCITCQEQEDSSNKNINIMRHYGQMR